MRTFTTSNGALVLVGKDAVENDRLTFQLSQKDDLWFHVKDVPGSHVLLRGSNLLQEDIQHAANVAAYYSKAKNTMRAKVEYCSIWNVSKPKCANAGLVEIQEASCIWAYPNANTT